MAKHFELLREIIITNFKKAVLPCYTFSFFFFFVFVCLFVFEQFHITTPQRVIHIMHYSPTLQHTPAQTVCTQTIAEGVHQEDNPYNPDTLSQH